MVMQGAFFDANTLFPSGGNFASLDWGLPNGDWPWVDFPQFRGRLEAAA